MPGKPREALLSRLGVRLLEAWHLALGGVDVRLAPIRFVVGIVEPVAEDSAKGSVRAGDQPAHKPATLTRLMRYFFK